MSILHYTPIYVNFTDLVESDLPFLQPDPNVTPRPALPDLADPDYTNLLKTYNDFTREDTILSPRFYLKIYPPGNLTYGSSLDPITINIPREGLLAGQLRLKLRPSFGYGVNSSYRVEYWKWYPFIPGYTKGKENPKQSKVVQKFIRQEYWLVPAIDSRTWGYYWLYPNRSLYAFPVRRRALASSSITFTRRFANPTAQLLLPDLSTNPLYSTVRDYYPNPIEESAALVYTPTPANPFEVVEVYNTVNSEKPYDKYIDQMYIEYSSSPPGGELPIIRTDSINVTYSINYVQPLMLKDILFLDYEEEGDYTMMGQQYRDVPRTMYDVQF